MGIFSKLNLSLDESDERHWAWQRAVERARRHGRHALGPAFTDTFIECDGCGHVTRAPATTCKFCGGAL